MSVTNVQLVKWSFPAFALIVGFFWYKRRRVDRLDPGGSTGPDGNKDINKKNGINLYDSGIHIDESFTGLNKQQQTTEEISISPRKKSESLDIPNKKSNSLPLSMKSGKSSGHSQPWYEDDDDDDLTDVKTTIVLGSNPKSSSFDMMEKCKSMSAENKDTLKMAKVIERVNEEEDEEIIIENKISKVTVKSLTASIANSVKSNDAGISGESKTSGQAISDRDSANHSPVSGVLDGSVSDEVRSEGSTDSGKGGSINGKGLKQINTTTYEFELSDNLVGPFIGKRGIIIQNFNTKADVHISINPHPLSEEMKLCVIKGLPDNINIALDLIRQKFTLKRYPELTLKEVHLTHKPDDIPWLTDLVQLQLAEGVNNDVMVCHILEPNRLFIQLATHPTYPSLRLLDHNMTQFYNTVESPPVPDQLTRGMLVVAYWYGKWVRALVEEPDETGEKHLVRLVDHGGYWTFTNAEMRKIRSDYITLPFQAIEVILANVNPINGEWKQEAYDVVAQLCTEVVGQAQIEAYLDSNIYVSLYIDLPKYGVISVAEELVARGLAEGIAFDDLVPVQTLPPM